MASLRSLTRNDGSSYVQVLYPLDGKQTSTSFHDMGSATKFNKLVASELRASRHPFDCLRLTLRGSEHRHRVGDDGTRM
jgi:hypothetical protein